MPIVIFAVVVIGVVEVDFLVSKILIFHYTANASNRFESATNSSSFIWDLDWTKSSILLSHNVRLE